MTSYWFALKYIVLASLSVSSAQNKWVWGDGRRSSQENLQTDFTIAKPVLSISNPEGAKRLPLFQVADNPRTDAKFFRDPSIKEGRPRYQVFEGNNEEPTPSAGSFPPGLPVRPLPYPEQPPPRPIRPYPEQPPPRPIRPYPEQPPPRPIRPLPPPPPPPPPPGHIPLNPPLNSRPPNDPDAGILTGPVPSWEKPQIGKNGDPTSFDSCKCVHSFNCKSPGLQFGSCDVGKQYCCYNNPGYGLKSEQGPIGGFGNKFGPHDNVPAVLAGPGGPVDQIRPDFPGLVGGHPRPLPHPGNIPPFYNDRNGPLNNAYGRSNNPSSKKN